MIYSVKVNMEVTSIPVVREWNALEKSYSALSKNAPNLARSLVSSNFVEKNYVCFVASDFCHQKFVTPYL